jgi:hypothetical protein
MSALSAPSRSGRKCLVLPSLLLAVLSACDSDVPPQVSVLFDLQAARTDFYGIPYPNELRRRADGTLDLAELRSGTAELVQMYLDQLARNEYGGFGTNSGAFFRFSGALDTGCLPAAPADSLLRGSALFWVNIDPRSPGYGERIPVRWRFQESAGLFIGPNSLAVLPVAGFVLRPMTYYAVILTEAVSDQRGRPLLVPATLRALLEARPPADPELAAAHLAYAPLRAFLEANNLTGVVAATLFRTGDPAGLVGRARRVLLASPPPSGKELVAVKETEHTYELHGTYEAPNFQAGEPPFRRPEKGGRILLDANGDPRPARSEKLRFALTVPRGAMPAAGWPLVLYAHGTGGDYRTFIGEGLGELLASARDSDGTPMPAMAMISIDQNLHGPRDPSQGSPEINFFNILNPVSTVYNVAQAGIDDFSLLRMAKQLVITRVPWARGSGHSEPLVFDPPLRFDVKRIYFMGHSQGGLTGTVFLAFEPEVRGAMLSGAGGGVLLSLLHKTEPFPIAPLLKLALDNEEPEEFHPLLNLIQQMLEPADPLNYGRLLVRHRPPGVPPKHLFLSQGMVDHYTPNSTTDALAAALEVPLAGPVLRPIEALDLREIKPGRLPLSGNLHVDDQAVTAALLQYRAVPNGYTCSDEVRCKWGYCDEGVCRSDGHFVVFNDGRANRHVARFFGTMARYGVPTLGP